MIMLLPCDGNVAAVRRQLDFSEIKTGNADFERDECAP